MNEKSNGLRPLIPAIIKGMVSGIDDEEGLHTYGFSRDVVEVEIEYLTEVIESCCEGDYDHPGVTEVEAIAVYVEDVEAWRTDADGSCLDSFDDADIRELREAVEREMERMYNDEFMYRYAHAPRYDD